MNVFIGFCPGGQKLIINYAAMTIGELDPLVQVGWAYQATMPWYLARKLHEACY